MIKATNIHQKNALSIKIHIINKYQIKKSKKTKNQTLILLFYMKSVIFHVKPQFKGGILINGLSYFA